MGLLTLSLLLLQIVCVLACFSLVLLCIFSSLVCLFLVFVCLFFNLKYESLKKKTEMARTSKAIILQS